VAIGAALLVLGVLLAFLPITVGIEDNSFVVAEHCDSLAVPRGRDKSVYCLHALRDRRLVVGAALAVGTFAVSFGVTLRRRRRSTWKPRDDDHAYAAGAARFAAFAASVATSVFIVAYLIVMAWEFSLLRMVS
jgi:hypothetical protein